MPDAFAQQLLDALAEPSLVIDARDVVTAANGRAAEALGQPPSALVGRHLADLTEGSSEDLSTFLRSCRRSASPLVGALTVADGDTDGGVLKVTCTGSRILAAENRRSVLLRLARPLEFQSFAALNTKIQELAVEVDRRRRVEKDLRAQHRLISFGRDVGLALTQHTDIARMLQSCAELVVEHLGAAFARIWTIEPGGAVLRLRASAGLYTHTDGAHSRIDVGSYKIGWIAQHRQPHLTNSVVGDRRVHDQEWAQEQGMVAFAGYPLVVETNCVGVIAMFARHELSRSTLEALESVSSAISVGIQRLQVARSLSRKAVALARADRRKDEFLAMLAHELRNPLAPLKSGLDILSMAPNSEQERETLAIMERQVEHIVHLVDDLLDVARLMRGAIELRRKPIQLQAVLGRAIEASAPELAARTHEFQVLDEAGEAWIDGDEIRLAQVLSNLLNNAAKYTPECGTVQVETTTDGTSCSIVVRDNGIGFDPDGGEELFDLFVQADRSLDRSRGGLGIGLTVAHRLVTMHGGTLSARSDGIDQGSEFVIELPLTAERPSDGDDAEQPKRVAACRVLVVDDSIGAAKLLTQLLTARWQHEVEVAHEGEAALDAAQRFDPDVVLLDIGLPGMSGYDVAQKLRARREHADTLLVAVTGYGTRKDRDATRAAGFDLHFVKPVGMEELEQVFGTLQQRRDEGR